MKFRVHRLQAKKSDYIILGFISLCLFLLVYLLCRPIDAGREFFIVTCAIVAMTLFGTILLCLFVFRGNYIVLNQQNIRVHFVLRMLRFKTYQYDDIKKIYVDDCPDRFVPMGRMGHFWSETHGKYIIARDGEDEIIFVCSFSENLWDLLMAHCKNQLDFVMDEAEFQNFKEERKKLAAKIEKETMIRGLEQYYRNK